MRRCANSADIIKRPKQERETAERVKERLELKMKLIFDGERRSPFELHNASLASAKQTYA